jgi:hypothetical protein
VDDGDLALELKIFVDREAPEAPESIDLAGFGTLNAAEYRLREHFKQPGVQAVTVGVGECPVGVVTRKSLGTAGTAAEVGTGERLELAGSSTRYRLLVFTCASCAEPRYLVHYPRELPRCPHGRMELQR